MSAASVVREADHHARSFVIQTTRRCVFRVVVLGACAHSVIATAGDPSSMATARIDDFCDRVWREHSIQPAAEATDSEYARRLSLDITGSIPHAADMRTFLADRSEIKRLRFAHAMLGGAGHVRHQMTVWHRLLLPPTMTPSVGRWHADLDAWLADQLRRDVPYDLMAHELLTTTVTISPEIPNGRPGRPHDPSPIAFYRVNEFKPENLAARTASVLLGIDLDCAQCHDHPWKPWTKDDFAAFAAFFAGVEPTIIQSGRVVAATERRDRKTFALPNASPVNARFLDRRTPDWPTSSSGRELLARWVTDPGNPYFARTAVNRMWSQFFGVPLATDEDPTFMELLDELAEVFVSTGYDVKVVIRAVVATRAYQMTSETTAADHPDQERYFARMRVRALSAEQLEASIERAAGLSGIVMPVARATFLAHFQGTEPDAASRQTSILQSLELLNGTFVAAATNEHQSDWLEGLAEAPWLSASERVEHLFLATCSRFPSREEQMHWCDLLESCSSVEDAKATVADVLWVLLNSSEFLFNH